MSVVRFARYALLLSPALALFGVVGWLVVKSGGPPTVTGGEPTSDGGKLVVLVVFDQMRGDFVTRWQKHFGPDGFEKLKRDGVWFSNVRLPYAAASTAPGHASIATGAPPSVHGIIENRWYERGRGKVVIAAIPDEWYDRVPASGDKYPAFAPSRLLAPTVGDALKEQKAGGRVFSFSLKDRAATLMGGKEPNGVYCHDTAAGEFHTSSYYRASVPNWVADFDRSKTEYRWADTSWDRLKPRAIYDELGPDDMPGEGALLYAGERTFPHRLPPVGGRSNYSAKLEATPFGSELLWEFAKTAINGEKLGRNGTTDLLCLSFSSTDLIGHAFGPDSHEVMDVTLRSDKLVAEMIAFLDDKIGRDRYSLVVTADHGSCPLPEVSVKEHPEARRLNYSDILGGLDAHLDKVFGTKDDVPGQWVEKDAPASACHPWVYLNRRTAESLDKSMAEVEEAAAAWMRERPTPLTVFTRTQLTKGNFKSEEKVFGVMAQLSFHPDRSGDLYVIPPAYDLVIGALSQGIDHGTPHDYDRQVSILVYGAGVPKLGERVEATSSLAVASILSHLLGVTPPAKAKEPLPPAFGR